jgi:hypothetical protein
MAIKPSGPLSSTEIAAEFGAPKPFSLSQFYRGGKYVPNSPANQKIPTGGSVSFSQFYGAQKQYLLTVNSNRENLDLRALFNQTYGDPGSTPVNVVVEINSGIVVGGVSGGNALSVGQFPSGSQITINNRGSVQGFAGGRNSGAGGSCVYGSYGSQTMVFNNYGSVYAGGGGGGVGGTGGKGGGGYYDSQQNVGQGWAAGPGEEPIFACYGPGDCPESCTYRYGAAAYCVGECQQQLYNCVICLMCANTTRVYTEGGAGGGGGAGGFGQGYARPRSGGDPGAGGSAGGQNAGVGGQGGTGGTGGDWGQPGAQGATGNTGANGNNGAGQGGTAGAGGGARGNYLIKGSANFTFNNQGQIAGGLA